MKPTPWSGERRLRALLDGPAADGACVQLTSGESAWPANPWSTGWQVWQRGPAPASVGPDDLDVQIVAGEVWFASFEVLATQKVDAALSLAQVRPRALARLDAGEGGRRLRLRAGDVTMGFCVSARAALNLAPRGPKRAALRSLVWKPLRRRESLIWAPGTCKAEVLRAYLNEEAPSPALARDAVLRLGAEATPSGFAQLFYAGREAFDTTANLSAAVNHFLACQGDLTRKLVPVLDETHRLGLLSRLGLSDAPRLIAASALGPGPELLRGLVRDGGVETDVAAAFLAQVLRPTVGRALPVRRLAALIDTALAAPSPAHAEAEIRAAVASPERAERLVHAFTWGGLSGPWFTDQ